MAGVRGGEAGFMVLVAATQGKSSEPSVQSSKKVICREKWGFLPSSELFRSHIRALSSELSSRSLGPTSSGLFASRTRSCPP